MDEKKISDYLPKTEILAQLAEVDGKKITRLVDDGR